MGLEGWLSGSEHLLLLQRSQIQFPESISSGSHLPVTPTPDKSNISFHTLWMSN